MITLFGVVSVMFLSGCHKFPNDTIAELKSNKLLSINTVTIHGFCNGIPFAVSLRNPATLQYLTKILRDGKMDMTGGSGYFIDLTMSDGEQSDLELIIPDDKSLLDILESLQKS